MIISLITLLVLFIIFKFFLFDKVKEHLAMRQKYIDDELRGAEKKFGESQERLSEADKILSDAKVEAQEIKTDARLSGQKEYDQTVADAKAEARRISDENKKQVIATREAMEEDMRSEMVEVAMAAAGKVVEKDLTTKDNEKLVNNFIDEVGK
jgi:F-type H+-transporting ATPase subunit b